MAIDCILSFIWDALQGQLSPPPLPFYSLLTETSVFETPQPTLLAHHFKEQRLNFQPC